MVKNWFSKALAIAAIAIATSATSVDSAEAQIRGYAAGIGFGYSQQSSVRFISPREDIPYFAKYPPVYYGDMVRRPYGISPYAVPPGIMPAEYSAPVSRPCAQTIVNPYVPKADAPQSVPAIKVEPVHEATDDKPEDLGT